MYMLSNSVADYRRHVGLLREVANTDTSKAALTLEKGGLDALASMAYLSDIHFARAAAALLAADTITFQRECYIAAKLCIMAGDYDAKDPQPFRLNNSNNVKILFGAFYAPNHELRDFLCHHREQIAYLGDKFIGMYAEPYLTHTILLAIAGNWDEVLKRYEAFMQKPITQVMQKRAPEWEFLAGLAQKDSVMMTNALQHLLELPLARQAAKDKLPFFDFMVQPQVLNHMRLAHYHGFDLDVAANIAPKRLSQLSYEEQEIMPYSVMADYHLTKPFAFQYVWLEKWLS